jgi:cyclase
MGGVTVKGVNFGNIRAVGDAVSFAARYTSEGADELVFLDIAATDEKRGVRREWVERVARTLDIPFTVGGGIGSVEDVSLLLESGADKVSVNSAAVRRPALITDLAKRFGSQCVVLAVDTDLEEGEWRVYLNGGRVPTAIRTLDWVRQGVEAGAGEILLTSMRHDGTKEGFALDITRAVSEAVGVPVIASGGAGNMDHFVDVFRAGCADAALAASIFHYGEIAISELKKHLKNNGIEIRQ